LGTDKELLLQSNIKMLFLVIRL